MIWGNINIFVKRAKSEDQILSDIEAFKQIEPAATPQLLWFTIKNYGLVKVLKTH